MNAVAAKTITSQTYGAWEGLSGADLIAAAYQEYGDKFAIVSSFGTESAVLLHLAATVDRNIPVIFLNTGKLFGETLRYKRDLTKRLGLTNVRTIEPDEDEILTNDPKGALWRHKPDACCAMRKVRPLARALKPLAAWATGRKAYQGQARAGLGLIETDGPRIKINPLAQWQRADIEAYFERFDLPPHPKEAEDYASVGCMPCTSPIVAGESQRDGRWRNQDKTECGIHMPSELAAAS